MDLKWFKNKYIAFFPWLPLLLAVLVCVIFLFKSSKIESRYRLRYKNYTNITQLPTVKKISCPHIKVITQNNIRKNIEKLKPKIKIYLTAIIEIDDRKIALINKVAYHEGDVIGPEISIAEIEENYVVLSVDSKIKKVNLGEEIEINAT